MEGIALCEVMTALIPSSNNFPIFLTVHLSGKSAIIRFGPACNPSIPL